MMKKFSIGVILPNTQLFGGVRRFFELGKLWMQQGHTMTIFSPEGTAPDWLHFEGSVQRLSAMDAHPVDVLFITETTFLPQMLQSSAPLKFFYHVGPRANLKPVIRHREIIILANSTNMYRYDRKRYGIETLLAPGGVHIANTPKTIAPPQQPFHIMCYGRLARKGKGTGLVVRAAEKLYRMGYDVKLLMFDRPLDEKGRRQIEQFKPAVPFEFILNHPVEENEQLFKRADVFVAVEKKGGWCNTAAEAMACGVPVVASETGTADFLVDGVTGLKVWRHPYFIRKAIQKLIGNIPLQQQLAGNGYTKIQTLDWPHLAERLLEIFKEQWIKQDRSH